MVKDYPRMRVTTTDKVEIGARRQLGERVRRDPARKDEDGCTV